jgi:hypothetical protein
VTDRAAAVVLAVAIAAGCGSSQKPSAGETPAAPPRDPRTPIEVRRDAACDALGPKLTACAVEDARADLGAGKIDQAQFDRDTAPAIQGKNTAEFLRTCKGAAYSSRQVRVLEVCFRDETRCAPLLDCLVHLHDTGGAGR